MNARAKEIIQLNDILSLTTSYSENLNYYSKVCKLVAFIYLLFLNLVFRVKQLIEIFFNNLPEESEGVVRILEGRARNRFKVTQD